MRKEERIDYSATATICITWLDVEGPCVSCAPVPVDSRCVYCVDGLWAPSRACTAWLLHPAIIPPGPDSNSDCLVLLGQIEIVYDFQDMLHSLRIRPLPGYMSYTYLCLLLHICLFDRSNR